MKFLVSSVTYVDDISQSQSIRLAQKPLQEDDVVEKLSFTERRQVFFRHNPPKAPSSEAHPHNFRNAQENENILCGRPQEHAVPASLFDEALCKFRHNLTVIEPTTADVRCFRNLRAAMTKMFTNEDARRVEFMQILIKGGVAPPTLRRRLNPTVMTATFATLLETITSRRSNTKSAAANRTPSSNTGKNKSVFASKPRRATVRTAKIQVALVCH